jgi:uncharacterized protein YfbU (UPF0304 family)
MLTWIERVMLHNQFKILEFLDPAHMQEYQEKQEIVGKGYEELDTTLNKQVSGEPTPKAITNEVHDIFDLFRILVQSKQRIDHAPISRYHRQRKQEGGQVAQLEGDSFADHHFALL